MRGIGENEDFIGWRPGDLHRWIQVTGIKACIAPSISNRFDPIKAPRRRLRTMTTVRHVAFSHSKHLMSVCSALMSKIGADYEEVQGMWLLTNLKPVLAVGRAEDNATQASPG